MWYKVLTILFSVSWNLTGYVIQGTNYFNFLIVKPYNICDIRHQLFYFPYLETLQDMWYKVLTILFFLSWILTGYMIQGTNYFIFPILKPYRICETRHQLFYFPYHETLQDMWYKVLGILFSLSWNLVGYVIQSTIYFIFPILRTSRICDTRC
jgi:hypothetical protein